ncbi:hypothetical protein [Mucilaginibacter psychrotolerans]|uniref:Lipoprotein n=1 Tax=Mucilaginibacter psychrotolerans TaxID=1524096 RepID=A0A4Y8S8E7_9SPHI|nr:hypothetical protein [Mucilaginibacter psychrotolerans]TFF35353.1 hypothetical protein E2R66_19035 [Mucilaginibacter psychrotolerans]
MKKEMIKILALLFLGVGALSGCAIDNDRYHNRHRNDRHRDHDDHNGYHNNDNHYGHNNNYYGN